MEELNVKVGDKVIVSGGWIKDTLATVTKITPTGRIRIDVFNDIQFDKYGRQLGCHEKWGSRKYIAICTPEYEKQIKEAAIIKTVIAYMHQVNEINIDQARAIWNILHPSQNIKEKE